MKSRLWVALSWVCYGLGHLVSQSLRIDWYHVRLTYPVYSQLMHWSYEIQDKCVTHTTKNLPWN